VWNRQITCSLSLCGVFPLFYIIDKHTLMTGMCRILAVPKVCRHNLSVFKVRVVVGLKKCTEFVQLIVREPCHFNEKNDAGWIIEVLFRADTCILTTTSAVACSASSENPFRAVKRPEGETERRFLSYIALPNGRGIQKHELGNTDT
jgi:hypothetical protein